MPRPKSTKPRCLLGGCEKPVRNGTHFHSMHHASEYGQIQADFNKETWCGKCQGWFGAWDIQHKLFRHWSPRGTP